MATCHWANVCLHAVPCACPQECGLDCKPLLRWALGAQWLCVSCLPELLGVHWALQQLQVQQLRRTLTAGAAGPERRDRQMSAAW